MTELNAVERKALIVVSARLYDDQHVIVITAQCEGEVEPEAELRLTVKGAETLWKQIRDACLKTTLARLASPTGSPSE